MIQLDGDMDLFGDGTLVVKRWVAHTPGSQMMTVRLKNTGLVILTGDNVYFRENVEKNIPAQHRARLLPDRLLHRLRVDPAADGEPEGRFLHRPRSRRVQGDEEGAGLLRLGATARRTAADAGARPAPAFCLRALPPCRQSSLQRT